MPDEYGHLYQDEWEALKKEFKNCRRCGAPVPIARVISLCDQCIKNSRIKVLCDES